MPPQSKRMIWLRQRRDEADRSGFLARGEGSSAAFRCKKRSGFPTAPCRVFGLLPLLFLGFRQLVQPSRDYAHAIAPIAAPIVLVEFGECDFAILVFAGGASGIVATPLELATAQASFERIHWGFLLFQQNCVSYGGRSQRNGLRIFEAHRSRTIRRRPSAARQTDDRATARTADATQQKSGY